MTTYVLGAELHSCEKAKAGKYVQTFIRAGYNTDGVLIIHKAPLDLECENSNNS